MMSKFEDKTVAILQDMTKIMKTSVDDIIDLRKRIRTLEDK